MYLLPTLSIIPLLRAVEEKGHLKSSDRAEQHPCKVLCGLQVTKFYQRYLP